MAVNDFEKQVQQKMDELRLRPSEGVWPEVELRIRKEKKRRFILWFFPLLFLLLGGTAWFIYNNRSAKTAANKNIAQLNEASSNNKNSTPGTNTNTGKIPTQVPEDNNNDQPVNKTKATDSTGHTVSSISRKQQPVSGTGEKSVFPTSNPKKMKKIINKPEPGKPLLKKEQQQLPLADDQQQKSDPSVTNKDPLITEQVTTIGTKDSVIKITVTPVATVYPVIKTDSINKLAVVAADSIVKAGVASKKDTTQVGKRNWKLYINAIAGISGLPYNKDFKEGYSLPNSPGGGPILVTPTIPAAPAKGFSWQFGLQAQRTQTKRTAISTGLNFSAYSVKQRTGVFVDSQRVFSTGVTTVSATSFYRNGSSNSYRNNYYYLEIPLSFDWQVNKGNRLPITWQNGFVTGWLMSTQALVYNQNANVFTKDRKSFNKLTVGYYSSLYAAITNRKGRVFTTGLYFNYQLTGLYRSMSSNYNRFLTAGIRFGYLLKK